jgi:hypothetical protein
VYFFGFDFQGGLHVVGVGKKTMIMVKGTGLVVCYRITEWVPALRYLLLSYGARSIKLIIRCCSLFCALVISDIQDLVEKSRVICSTACHGIHVLRYVISGPTNMHSSTSSASSPISNLHLTPMLCRLVLLPTIKA